jgi:hypothetical protein
MRGTTWKALQRPSWRAEAPLAGAFRWSPYGVTENRRQDKRSRGVWVGDTWDEKPHSKLWTFRINKEYLPGRTARLGWRWVLYVEGACVGIYTKKGAAVDAAQKGTWK